MTNEKLSADSLIEATQDKSQFSGHGQSKGAAGYIPTGGDPESELLSSAGQSTIINPRDDGFGAIRIGAAWDNLVVEESRGLIKKMLKKATRQGVDIDLGCLYQMNDGTRGCIQAFGDMLGDYNAAPFISLSGDERTGNAPGDDEFLQVNGTGWDNIKRILIYAYIYEGVPNWAEIKPQIQVSVPGEHPMVVIPDVQQNQLAVCAIAMMENIRGGIRLTNHSEYFPGHEEMDRAFGFGIEWVDGHK